MIRQGTRSPDVRRLQVALNARGLGPRLRVDGIYGRKTAAAVSRWKLSWGVRGDDGAYVTSGQLDVLASEAKLGGIPWTVPVGDWSGHQGDEDYAALAAAGDVGAIIKLTEGLYYKSGDARVQLPEARKHMRFVDAYAFPGTRGRRKGKGRTPRTFGDPVVEAVTCYAYAQEIGTPIDRFWLDGEAGLQKWSAFRRRSVPVMTRRAHTANARWWLDWLEEMDRLHRGLTSGVYTSAPHVYAYIRLADPALLAELAARPLWFANYPGKRRRFAPFKSTAPWTRDDIDIWQWDGDAEIAAYDGPVDRNLARPEFIDTYPLKEAA